MLKRKVILVCLMILVVCPVAAQNLNKAKEESERASNAAAVLDEIMKTPDQSIPQGLLDRAHAIAIIPHVIKGALGFGGRHGKGLIATRQASGSWGTPAFVDLSGGSFGLQLGVSATDLILVFIDEAGLRGLLAGKLKFGVDAAAAAGPVGRTAEASTDVQLKSAIYSYSRSKGLFAGVALDGAVLSIDDSANHKVYGIGVTGTNILIDNKVKPNSVVQPFIDSLTRNAPRRTK
ncbi:MAG TPA: lipid-binding SYLF domain-containing protein [Acidobacteriota bacterium]|jgi:lipid-binding SYLF domain-containing protein|nr:lipid-binding SYLF domain-containing protein [Acidobacteriota bacterium]